MCIRDRVSTQSTWGKIRSMIRQLNDSLSKEDKEVLDKLGFYAYRPRILPNFLNPHADTYWLTNAAIFTFAAFARNHATKTGAPRSVWSFTMGAIPFFALLSKVRLDLPGDGLGARKTLKERLEFAPITRKAWERAIAENTEYQNRLRREIAELERKVKGDSH
eukprot:TRINITY_DN4145_c0_g1_i18.p1 TRINITY_DN4145_c0_g1~~TRINITY_DN4145_c0_g1_i18.p1  ORF type:complete len:163 (+),score=28.71 TRINITY_DN4145_c0_g1_i18:66-554(+)